MNNAQIARNAPAGKESHIKMFNLTTGYYFALPRFANSLSYVWIPRQRRWAICANQDLVSNPYRYVRKHLVRVKPHYTAKQVAKGEHLKGVNND